MHHIYKLPETLDAGSHMLTNKIIIGDALEVMKRLPDSLADVVFLDPPYHLQLQPKRLIRWNVRTPVRGWTIDGINFHHSKNTTRSSQAYLLNLRG